jgi:hypothetical protein
MLYTGAKALIVNGVSYSGVASLRSSTTGSFSDMKSPVKAQGAREWYGRMYARVDETATDWYWRMYDGSGNQLIEITSINNGVVKIEDSSGSVEITTTLTLTLAQWYLFELHVIHDGTSGRIEFFVDGVSQGDTGVKALAVGDGNGAKQMELLGLDTARWDDITLNNITMRYDSGTGAVPVVDEVLTGADSGAFASVTAVLPGGTGTSGTVILHLWDGTAFVDGEVLTGSTAVVAAVDAPNSSFVNGFEPNSGYSGEGIVRRFTPAGVGNSSQLTNSAGTSVANWSYIDDASTTDFVEATAADQRDTYALLVDAEIPVADSITHSLVIYNKARGTMTGIDGMKTVIRYEGADYDGDRVDLPVDYELQEVFYNTRPDDDEIAWDSTAAAAIESGMVFVE